jgi:DMSO/TMAO reductase YedYZ molybdopterin-dependent catalytic subunit
VRAFPEKPPPGPFRPGFWRSPLRGPWLASFLSAALLPLVLICAVTGFLSHAAYEPELGRNAVTPRDGIGFDVYGWTWPAATWLYAINQTLHVVSGLAAIPILLAKLWTVIPKLFEWPPVRSAAHGIERLGLALLVGGSLFVFATGVLNIQLYYPFKFSFVPAHYYGAFVFLAGLAIHIATKLPVFRAAFREHGVVAPLRDGLDETRPEPGDEHTSAPDQPAAPSISRRGLVGVVGAGSALLAFQGLGQSIGGPLRDLALFAPRGAGTNDFPVNKTAATARITPAMVGDDWRLEVVGAGRDRSVSRAELLAMPLVTARLPIACVEGWTTTQEWTGVRLRDLIGEAEEVLVESLQPRGAFRQVTLNRAQAGDDQTLLALRVNGEDLPLDHGYPARLMIPGAPGVHNTKWLSRVTVVRA